MHTYTAQEAQANLKKLLEEAAEGEPVTILQGDEPCLLVGTKDMSKIQVKNTQVRWQKNAFSKVRILSPDDVDLAAIYRLQERLEKSRAIQQKMLDKSKPQQQRRELGFMRGQFTVPEDFDRMFEDEIAEMFYGQSDS